MLTAITLALMYGILIALTRTANGRLGMERGAFQASFWNHIVGFIFLSLMLLITSGFGWSNDLPWFIYLGGVLGAFFVAINAYVIPRIGVTKSALLVVSGQMLTGVVIGYQAQLGINLIMQLLGVGLILLGIYLAQRGRKT